MHAYLESSVRPMVLVLVELVRHRRVHGVEHLNLDGVHHGDEVQGLRLLRLGTPQEDAGHRCHNAADLPQHEKQKKDANEIT